MVHGVKIRDSLDQGRVRGVVKMPGHSCIVCGNTPTKDKDASFHRFPTDPVKRASWLQAFGIDKSQLKSQSRVCCRHFRDGDTMKEPLENLGKRFASPIKGKHPRAKRAKTRESSRELAYLRTSMSPVASSSRSVTPSSGNPPPPPETPLTASVGEQWEADYHVHELPVERGDTPPLSPRKEEVLVNTALLSRVEALEAENEYLRASSKLPNYFRLEDIRDNDRLIRFYTGFGSFMILMAFFEFLGPVVNELNYWGTKQRSHQRHRSCKLDPINQFFLMLVRLRLNLKVKDLAFRFGISTGTVTHYVTTWICFLYHHLKELDWTPSVEQVTGTLPHSFRLQFPTTFAIIDGSEIFIQTPSDLHAQSSTWSQYKHHNTAKFLVACTPNGAVSYISPVFVGSISDIELTRKSGFLTTLKDKPGISIMADRGFTIKDMLKELNIELNLPPFMEGKQQLTAEKVQEGRTIASLRIHVERAIGRIKTFRILQETIPITLARLTNQIVHVCAYLSNFHPGLVPPPEVTSESDVDTYFDVLSDSEALSDTDSDSSCDD